MQTKSMLWASAVLLMAALTACTTGESLPTLTAEPTQPTTAQDLPVETEDPVIVTEEIPCLSPTLGIELTLPSPEWECEVTNARWLKLASPIFEVNISNLGRGPFCNPGLDDSCQITPFYENEVVDLQLYTAGGQPREIFGLAEFSDPQTSVWVAITWQDMANHALTEDEITEIQRLVSSLSLLSP
jgi:hypothetical protein